MKTEVYSWRLSTERKIALEAEARREGKSVSQLLDEMSSEWLQERRATRNDEEVEQEAIRRRALALAGTIRGGDPTRSERASELAKESIRQKHEKERDAAGRSD